MDHPALWYQLFGEGKLTEMLQWLALGLGAVTAAAVATRLNAAEDRRQARFWGLLSLGLVLMLIEDAGNIRHTIAAYPTDLLAGVSTLPGDLTRLFVMFAIAVPRLVAFVAYGRAPLSRPGLRGYLLLGLACCAVAASTSVISGPTGLYDQLGSFINERLAHGKLIVMESDLFAYYGTFEYWLADSVYEETVELLGAAGFLAAAWTAHLGLRAGEHHRVAHPTREVS